MKLGGYLDNHDCMYARSLIGAGLSWPAARDGWMDRPGPGEEAPGPGAWFGLVWSGLVWFGLVHRRMVFCFEYILLYQCNPFPHFASLSVVVANNPLSLSVPIPQFIPCPPTGRSRSVSIVRR